MKARLNGKEFFVPIETPLAKNCTLAMVPVLEEAVPFTVCATFTGIDEPAAGPVTVTLGEPTVTRTVLEVTLLPKLSITTAVRSKIGRAHV